MKKRFFKFLILVSISAQSQSDFLSGVYTEYKRTLWNGDDGSKYTFNQKPFEPTIQYEFKKDGKNVIVYDGKIKSEQSYLINGDTLIMNLLIGKGEYAKTIYTRYIIIENKNELILREFKVSLDENYYLRKYYFKKNNSIQKDFLQKNDFEIFTLVDEMPSYPNGVEEMKKFINEEVSKSKLKGNEKVFLRLLINPEGGIIDLEVLTNPKVEYVEEAVKIVRKFPTFTAGKQNGKPVYVNYNIPVKFIN